MTIHAPLAESSLTIEQWQHVEALARSVTPVQARWLSGYFAGIDAGLLRAGEGEPVAAALARTLTILYGTETGNARDLAKQLAASATERGLAPKLADLADYKARGLKDEQDLLFIVSTGGEGDPPAPAIGFFEFLEGPRAPKLPDARFAVLALGDSTYEQYCEAGKRVDRRMEELGATRLAERIDCDIDYEEQAAAWSDALLDRLLAELAAAGSPAQASARPVTAAASATHDKRNPFAATVLENIRIVGRHSTKETRHVELDLTGSGLAYQPGDALGVAAQNGAGAIEDLLGACGLGGSEEVALKGATMPLADALRDRFEISTASPRFAEQWATLSDAAELKALAAGEPHVRHAFLEQHHVADIVRRFPVPGVGADALLAGLRPLQPRLYSLASSQAAVGDEAHLTVAPVRYQLHGSDRGGVASTQIADRLEMGATVPVYVQENPHFRLPGDEVPVIMVGPGTGVAPFRAFLQEREARGAPGRNWLFFGERNFRSDFLYQVEWQEWLEKGPLTRLDVAFSRDAGEKVYVQHRMLERSADLYAWLEEGAHFYVCGNAKAMAADVHGALISIVERAGGRTREAAEDYVRELTANHRYSRDVY
ncbi:assimilatory sulfite reductase (NADPH) flavoprotein subunit [Sphingomonas ginkgonis]|uniref:Sulfite reductase [NADPH] flavoprotein alpha-component n=1 Tax=Sphingomonas ginkgonis TaxID=2315330 RepID=A0A429V6C8_9SPHN|nr:assimilatory sulfite reductase (NADPH) flavoprotein subunit [Sphingomonas ginkgonis]RST29491.1 assimilatory sulfite reductase (NADPH) flavoprotein subunit [Sphingomonas ginkgonis]